MRPRLIVATALAVTLLCMTVPVFAQSHDLILSPEWLRANLTRDDIVIIHVSSLKREYQRAHIPGARYLWAPALHPSNPEGSIELPTPDAATVVFRALGLTSRSHVVLYGVADNLTPVTRAFLALEYYLPELRVSMLNGGLDAWKRAGYDVTSLEPAPFSVSRVTVTSKPGLIVSGDWLRARLNDPTIAIVDARARTFYEGKGGGRPRPGRIPGAHSVPFTDVVDSTNALKSADTLRALFLAAGGKPGESIVTYCHVGLQASLVHLAARVAGFRSRLYDLSFEEWSWREDLPVEKD